MSNLTPEDIDAAKEAARAITDLTDHVCGSTSLNEYKQHLATLDSVRDAITQSRNLAKSEIHRWQDIERELARIEKKLLDHKERTKGMMNDLHFSRPQ